MCSSFKIFVCQKYYWAFFFQNNWGFKQSLSRFQTVAQQTCNLKKENDFGEDFKEKFWTINVSYIRYSLHLL